MKVQLRKRQRMMFFIAIAFAAMSLACVALAVSGLKQSPLVTVQEQENSPLRISSINVTTVELKTPEYNYEVTNISGKTIRAYAIRRDDVIGGSRSSSGVSLSHMLSLKSLLRPGQSRAGGQFGDTTHSEAPEEIILSVDFVEFDDGSMWGNDTFRTAERLAGQRAGGRAALSHFKQILKTKGHPALVNALTSKAEEGISPQGNSSEWIDGYKAGVGLIRHRLKKAHQKGGKVELESELQLPYDASEERPEQ